MKSVHSPSSIDVRSATGTYGRYNPTKWVRARNGVSPPIGSSYAALGN